MAIDGLEDNINLSQRGHMVFPFSVDGTPVAGVMASNSSVGRANHQTSLLMSKDALL